MEFEFDPAKDAMNRSKHGVPLVLGMRVFDDPDHQIVASFRLIDGEERFKAIGTVAGKLFTTVYVWRGAAVRLISVRRSNTGEQRDYDSHSRRSE